MQLTTETGEVLTTIRVSGIPSNVTEEEFNCWFLFASGFEQATLAGSRTPNGAQAGWARFSSQDCAQNAMHFLNGKSLTADQSIVGGVLAAEFAKKNFKPSASRKVPQQQYLPQQHFPAPAKTRAPIGGSLSAAPGPAAAGAISTLFIWKLMPGSNEEEMSTLFAEYCPGFERIKFDPPVEGKPGRCWVKFASVAHASRALEQLRKYALPSNPTETMQIDYAKADLDTPKRPHGEMDFAAAPMRLASSRPPAQPRSRNSPCDTMFVGNIAPHIPEDEISYALSTLFGFERMKLVGAGTDKVFALAGFDSVSNCAEAIQTLHGNALPSAPSTALTCEFAKNTLAKEGRR